MGRQTFTELYKHRHALFIALIKSHPEISWRANNDDDGTNFEGLFLAGMDLPTGAISYHLPIDKWESLDYTGIRTTLRAPKWDGHKSLDIIDRLNKWVVK